MKKRLILTTLALAVAALAVTPFLYAGPGRGPHGEGGPRGLGLFGHLAHLREELDLSDQQVDELQAIFASLREQNAPYRDQLHGGMKGIAQTLLANPNDVAAAQALLDQQTAAENALKANALQATAKALNVLNADQRTKLSTMLEERASRWQGRRR